MKAKIGVGILGGTGYGAGELLAQLAKHPWADVVSVVSSSAARKEIGEIHPHLSGFYEDLCFDETLKYEELASYDSQIIFSALPHGTSAHAISELTQKASASKFKFIDLSGDFRLQNAGERKKHYPETEAEALSASQFVYGLSEKNREQIRKARYVANPGCLASACALAVLPLMHSAYSGKVIFDAKTGSSGAGRTLSESFHHPFRHANVNAYKMLEHRHEPEIRETLGDLLGERIHTVFVPHVLPISRGIFASAYLALEEEVSSGELLGRYRKFYADSPFVRIRETSPDINSVLGSNFCDIAVVSRGKDVVAMATLDNLIKGMAGQAIQNMNLLCGLPETEGLWQPALSLA